MKRGEVWWVDLGEPRGSAPAYKRPVVIVQDDLLTGSLLKTVMVVPLTTNRQRALAVGNVEITAKQSKLKKTSVALVCQVTTVDKALLVKRVGPLSNALMARVDRGLELALGLSSHAS